jgi:hypothetical protein
MINARNLSVICARPGLSLFLGPSLSHIFELLRGYTGLQGWPTTRDSGWWQGLLELLRIYTTRHLHCTVGFSFFYSTMMTWSHSGPLFPPMNIFKHTQLFGKFWRWGEEPKGPFPKIAHRTLQTIQGS